MIDTKTAGEKTKCPGSIRGGVGSILVWCHEGNATVNAPDRVLQIQAGDLVIAPQGAFISGQGVTLEIPYHHTLHNEHEIWAQTTHCISLGVQWSARLIFEYSLSLLGSHNISAEFADFLRQQLPMPTVSAPAMPHAAVARTVAEALVSNPVEHTSLLEFAQKLQVSTRTVQRQFQADTGMVFSEWRAAYRVHIAAKLLAHDFTVADVSDMVGFDATSSLIRAFRRHTGMTPRSFSSRARTTMKNYDAMQEKTLAHKIPASTVFARCDYDQLLWIYQGTATVTTKGYCRFVGTGETITVPAGTTTRVDIAAGSIAIPVPGVVAQDISSLAEAITAIKQVNYDQQRGFHALEKAELTVAQQQLQPMFL
ncbi:AraC family transcriptional regulator [Corynebacterium sp. sy017]|uniref:AraC family transcriptional regulator n=1 Tax=unclassified Corynebacterium TaxID=2624378 RepID=UPI0011851399|nr:MULTISPECIES: helix-turn-helix transcriptional regulator [unclassified Corynebacterium]MBP3088900.1 AraC family transcriptional regulator [Corynebacterium sp. sy017]TSD91232.1 AraC family transcriptional regulator [Corynebacterium sp. SY003]